MKFTYIKAFILSILLTIILSSCSGNGGSSNSSVPAKTYGIVSGNVQGLVYLNNTLLAGNQPIDTIDGSPIVSIVIDTIGNVYAGLNNGAVFKCDVDGIECNSLGNSQVNNMDSDEPVNGLAIDSSNNIYAALDGGVYEFNSNLESWLILGQSIQALSIAIDNNDAIYVGSNSGQVFKYSGSSWNLVASSIGESNVTSITTFSNNVYANQGNSVFKFNGILWSDLGVVTESYNVFQVAINSNGIPYVAAGNQVYT